jgi:hypothetical protein
MIGGSILIVLGATLRSLFLDCKSNLYLSVNYVSLELENTLFRSLLLLLLRQGSLCILYLQRINQKEVEPLLLSPCPSQTKEVSSAKSSSSDRCKAKKGRFLIKSD